MDKKSVKTILSVVLGICLLIMVYSAAAFVLDCSLYDDLILLGAANGAENELMFIKWSTASLVCLLVPTFVSYAFTFFGKSRIFSIFSAALSFVIVAVCIAFVIISRDIAINDLSLTQYTLSAEYFNSLIRLAVPAAIACAYFILNSVAAFKKKESTEEPANEEI